MYFARSPDAAAHPPRLFPRLFRQPVPQVRVRPLDDNLGRRTFSCLFSQPQFRSRFIVDRAAQLR